MPHPPSVITIGNFDGVHLGHQAILASARELANQRGARVLALTFDPMPVAVLRPGAGPPHLGSIQQRTDALKHAGADDVVVVNPTRDVLSQEATHYIDSLIEQYDAVGFVEGEDFHFGHKRGGDMKLLSDLGKQQGLGVASLPRVQTTLSDCTDAPISSSLIRWLVGRGRVEDARRCLGRPFELVGEIVKGEQRGRTIGVPTINLDPDAYRTLITPMDGVYAGTATLDDDPETPIPAAISVGVKPTFGHDQLTIEAHLIDHDPGDPDAHYGKTVNLTFAHWLRDQYPFKGVDNLKQQLHRDIEAAQQLATDSADGYT